MTMKMCQLRLSLVVVVCLIGWWNTTGVIAAEAQRQGGVLRVAIAGDPPSLDMHQEQTFMVTIPMSTVYNTLVMFDPHGFPDVVGDLAKSWEASDNGKTYTFKLHEGIKF